MSLFEYVTVMISMILALALGQLLMSAASLAKHRKHLIPFVPYILWFGCLFLTLINHWWSIWDLRAIEWNYAAFLYILIAPTLMFFAVGLLAVKNVGDGEINLETEFEQVRPLFLAILFAYVLVMWFDGPLLAGQEPLGAVGILHAPMLAVYATGILSSNKRVQIAVPILITVALSVVMVVRFRS